MSEDDKNFRTHLSEEDLEHFKNKLLKEKEESEKEIERLKERAENIEDDFDDRQSGQDHHPGDVASDAQIKKTSFTLLEKQREKHQKIEAALERIESGTYGVCLNSGKPIAKERLEAIPYAMHAVDAKT